jgi:hypothetical protein
MAAVARLIHAVRRQEEIGAAVSTRRTSAINAVS